MKSLILHIASHHLMPLLLLVSVFYLLRGHNYPGGGFIGALIASAGLILFYLTHGKQETLAIMRIDPVDLIGGGLLVVLLSALIPLFLGLPVLTGQWLTVDIPVLGHIHLGTPMLFDFGVYFAVIGVNLTVVFTLSEE
jgi:multicomponent Na+:H+ antiporter subunit B